MTQVASSTGSAVKHSPNVGSTITRTRCGVAAFTRDGMRPNENKMSDGGRGRASLGVRVWKSSQKWSVQRSAVRSIAWLDVLNYGERSFLFVAFVNLAVLDDPSAQVPHTDNTRLVVVECKINKSFYRL